jgi:hypothetical protein
MTHCKYSFGAKCSPQYPSPCTPPYDSPDKIKECIVNNNIQFGPNPKIIVIISKLIEEARQKQDIKLLRFLLRIQVDLTKDKKLENELKSLE